MSLLPSYTDDYRRKVFDTWVLSGRCSVPKLLDIIPVNEDGNKPNHATIRAWMEDEDWHSRADIIQASAMAIADTELIQTKAEMLRQQYKDAVTIAKKALDAISSRGFDTSAAAVNAYFKASEEQRRVAGLAEFMEKIGNMSDEQIEAEIAERMARMKDAVVGEVIENKSDDGDDIGADPQD